jgi:hypothetical protein
LLRKGSACVLKKSFYLFLYDLLIAKLQLRVLINTMIKNFVHLLRLAFTMAAFERHRQQEILQSYDYVKISSTNNKLILYSSIIHSYFLIEDRRPEKVCIYLRFYLSLSYMSDSVLRGLIVRENSRENW